MGLGLGLGSVVRVRIRARASLMPGSFSHQKATAKRSDQKLTPSMAAASGSTKGLSGAQMSATEMVRRAKA